MSGETKVVQLPVRGMTCDHCADTVRRALEGVPGVRSASVDLAEGRAELTLDPTQATRERLKLAVEEVGYRVPDDEIGPAAAVAAIPSPQLVTIGSGPTPALASVPNTSSNESAVEVADAPGDEEWNLAIGGMHCASCVARVEGALSGVPGVSEARVNLATERASVVVERGRVREEQLAEAVARAGYSARRAELAPGAGAESLRLERDEQRRYWRNRLVVGVLLAVPLVVLGYGPMLAPALFGSATWVGWAMFVPATMLQVYLGGPYLRGAWTRLKQGSTNMDTLIALGTTTAYAYSLVQLLLDHGHGPTQGSNSFMVIAAILIVVTVTAVGALFFGGAPHREAGSGATALALHDHH